MLEPKGKTRFLLLLDLTGKYDCATLKLGYQAEAKKIKKGKSIRIVYASQDATKDCHFVVKA